MRRISGISNRTSRSLSRSTRFPARVHRKGGKVRLDANQTQNVVTYTVEVITDNSSGMLLPYMTANVQFEVEEHKDVLMVANAALRWVPTQAQIAPEARGGRDRGTQREAPAQAAEMASPAQTQHRGTKDPRHVVGRGRELR